MNSIQKVAIEKAVSFLKGAKLNYAIVDNDGNKWGSLEIVAKRKRSESKYPRGTVRNHFMDFLINLKKDDAVSVPFGEFNPTDLQSNICAWAHGQWGKGCCSTAIDKQTGSIIVFRIG